MMQAFTGDAKWLSILALTMALSSEPPAESTNTAPAVTRSLPIHISWGHQSARQADWNVRLFTNDITLRDMVPVGLEAGERLVLNGCDTSAGNGDVDGLEFTVTFAEREIKPIKPQQIWKYLLDHSDAETTRRIQTDPGYRLDSRKLTVQLAPDGTRGFSLTVDQLLTHRTFWIPELDVYVSAGENSPSFAKHQKTLAATQGRRVLDTVNREPEATYQQFTSLWDDMGSPRYHNPHSIWPGHIVCLSWDSAIPKFGVDRGANVWNDYGNPDHFHLGFDFGELNKKLETTWKRQTLEDGLPVITTMIEDAGVRYRIEQFAYPLHGPPSERRGDIPMVLLEKLTVQNQTGEAWQLPLKLTLRREVPSAITLVRTNGALATWVNSKDDSVWLALKGSGFQICSNWVQSGKWTTNHVYLSVDLPANGSRELVLLLPSAPVLTADQPKLAALDYTQARADTLQFWSNYLARGAMFEVPDPAVNTLFRASLWHSLRLPRRHGGEQTNVIIDLPYSNFAYDQHGTPWPVNQAIYVDYMLYDLRGYHTVSAEELAAMYRNNQEPNGHVGGFANWGVYTPSMVYAVAKHYLLSGDRASLERLLPPTLKALEWCLQEMRQADERGGTVSGLMLAPLNDLSHDKKAWAFNQAYLFAGPDLLGKALEEIGHPRATECQAAARKLHEAIRRGFTRASVQSPLVSLRDGTWIPYVPGDALNPKRLLDIWYPTDVDTGPLHLSRLKALDPQGELTTFLLHDHEDNLFFKQWGMANEPVYNQHATALLFRDEPKAVIRAFYSMLACAFSHSVFESVEHRWGWGQYFCPPSTDGAWFDLYRHMLIHERDDGSLLLCQATPRKWLEHSRQIRIERAPTYFGPLSMTLESRAAQGEISVKVQSPQRKKPSAMFIRLRHPDQKRIRTVEVNGQPWQDFDPQKEWVRIANPTEQNYQIIARY